MSYQISFHKNLDVVIINTEIKIQSTQKIWLDPKQNKPKQSKLVRELFKIDNVSRILTKPHQIIVVKKTGISWLAIMFSIVCCLESSLKSGTRPKKTRPWEQKVYKFADYELKCS